MTKREIIKEVRDIVTGQHGHEAIQVSKTGRSWNVYTSFASVIKNCVQSESNSIMFHHDRNSATLAEIEAEFNQKWFENVEVNN